jgi:hypothetical protein
MVFFGLGILVMLLQLYLLHHLLAESKPYKVVDPSKVYQYTCIFGLPISFLLALGLTYLIRHRMTNILLPLIPALIFPILVWTAYNILFIALGIDFFSGSGDFTVRQIELEFSHDLIEVLYLGSIGGLIATGLGFAVSKVFKLEDGQDLESL